MMPKRAEGERLVRLVMEFDHPAAEVVAPHVADEHGHRTVAPVAGLLLRPPDHGLDIERVGREAQQRDGHVRQHFSIPAGVGSRGQRPGAAPLPGARLGPAEHQQELVGQERLAADQPEAGGLGVPHDLVRVDAVFEGRDPAPDRRA